jgi:hypothetical protein
MKRNGPIYIGACMLLFAVLVTLPVSGLTDEAGNNMAVSGTTESLPFISATVTPGKAPAGEPVTISGVATGGNLTAGVQIWAFAGNYVNVSTVPVSDDGTFSKTFETTGLPPALYYVIVQSPGKDGTLNIVLETSGQYSGQVVNTKTGNLVFNFTGTGSVQDAAAAQALSAAFNLPGVDDIYTKCTFEIIAAEPLATSITAAEPIAPAATTTATKSPVSMFAILAGAGFAICAFAWRGRE